MGRFGFEPPLISEEKRRRFLYRPTICTHNNTHLLNVFFSCAKDTHFFGAKAAGSETPALIPGNSANRDGCQQPGDSVTSQVSTLPKDGGTRPLKTSKTRAFNSSKRFFST
jgi:hypothetical protein